MISAILAAMSLGQVGGALGFEATLIDGKAQSLAKFKGQVVMIVNVASKCGLTPQYSRLQEMYHVRKDAGFVILGFPANEFGGQEPGSNAEILEFCTSTYNVTFPLFQKVIVKGEGIHPLYEFLTSEETSRFPGEIKWNFTKFLIDRNGELIARFEPRTSPDAPEVVKAVDDALAKRG